MTLAELTQLIKKISATNELIVPMEIMCIIVARPLFRRFAGKSGQQSSLQVQDRDKNIKFKGPAVIAGLIILLNYFRKK
jgi:hypothetical protein